MNPLPNPGDLVWLDFDPQAGHEQAGRRPALVLSAHVYHEKTVLTLVCPITSNISPYPFKVMLPQGALVSGAILADQIKSIDRTARHLSIIGPAPQTVLVEVQAMLAVLLGIGF